MYNYLIRVLWAYFLTQNFLEQALAVFHDVNFPRMSSRTFEALPLEIDDLHSIKIRLPFFFLKIAASKSCILCYREAQPL